MTETFFYNASFALNGILTLFSVILITRCFKYKNGCNQHRKICDKYRKDSYEYQKACDQYRKASYEYKEERDMLKKHIQAMRYFYVKYAEIVNLVNRISAILKEAEFLESQNHRNRDIIIYRRDFNHEKAEFHKNTLLEFQKTINSLCNLLSKVMMSSDVVRTVNEALLETHGLLVNMKCLKDICEEMVEKECLNKTREEGKG